MLQPMKLVSFVALAVVACLTGSVATVGAGESAPVGTKRALPAPSMRGAQVIAASRESSGGPPPTG